MDERGFLRFTASRHAGNVGIAVMLQSKHSSCRDGSGCGRRAGEAKTKRPPEGETGGRIERENLAGYFCASVRRFTIIPEKRTM